MHPRLAACLNRATLALAIGSIFSHTLLLAQPAPRPIDRDLLEIDIPKLESLYTHHKYTVTQVTQWYLDRIALYNPVYRPVVHLDATGALATAAHEDATAKSTPHGPLWGVPILIKDNTSVAGLITSDGWSGFNISGKEFIPTTDATVVKKLRAAGAIILGHSNMPDFAASDTNFSSAGGRTGNAYIVRYSPGGSSGGTATAVAANLAIFGTGTDTANSVRIPAATDSLVGLLPTRGLTSIAGIHPLDWLLDNTGPLARNVTDAAIALDIMAGEDPQDFRTAGSTAKAQKLPHTAFLKPGALKGKRFGVPTFILNPPAPAAGSTGRPPLPLDPTTREAFLKSLDQMRAAGATIVIDDTILAEFPPLIHAITTKVYRAEGTLSFLRDYGPAIYKTPEQFEAITGTQFPPMLLGLGGRSPAPQRTLETDPEKDATFFGPQQKALDDYDATLARLHLDGFVYPALQMPPNDETPVPGQPRSEGPHSATGWVNNIGVPAIVLPGGFYANGLPFGIEISAARWHDGDLIGYAYAYEQATHNRRPPTLITTPE